MSRHATLGLVLAASVLAVTCRAPHSRSAAMIPVVPRAPTVIDGSEPESVRAANDATTERIEIERSAFLDRERRRRDAQNQRTLARAERIVAAGGFETSVRAEMKELEERLPRAFPNSREITARRLAADQHLAEFDCTGPTIQVVNDWDSTVEPDVDVIIEGCQFGTRPGEVRLVVNQFGGYLSLDVKIWKQDVILARLPPMESVLDQAANLLVIRPTGEHSPLYPVDFRATRDIRAFSGIYLQPVTSQLTDFDLFDVGAVYCNVTDPATGHGAYAVQTSFTMYHGTRYDLNGRFAGRDSLDVDLLNGWVTSSWSIYRPSFPTSGNFTVASGIVDGSPHINLEVDWEISGYSETVGYSTYILVTGPKGTPYATTLAPGIQWVDPSIAPGLPCIGH